MKAILDRHRASLLVCLLLINALALLPLLTTGFIADDILNSQIRGHMIQTDRSLWGATSFYAMEWLRNQGRLFPLAFYTYSVFYLLETVLLYKFFVLGVILASIAAFFVFLRRLIGSELIPAIAVLLLPVMFQFRVLWDPILAFCAQYPMITLLLFCSLSLFLREVDESDRRALWWAALLFLCSGLIFEVTYPMFLVYAVIAYFRLKDVKSAVRASWPFLAVTFCLALVSAILRTWATALSSTYQMHLDAPVIIKTYCVQLFGAVPFSYFFLDPHAVFANRIGRWPATLMQVLPLVVLVAAVTVVALRRKLSNDVDNRNITDRAGILTVGILLLLIPPSLISLSPKFQAQTWGDAYLPVYMSSFGVALLLAVGLEKLYRWGTRLQTSGQWIASVALCLWLLLFGFNFRNNWLVAQTMNEMVWNPRVLLEEALDKGLLTGVSQKAVLLVNGTDLWDNADEYSLKTGIRFAVYRLNEVRDLTPVFQTAGGTCEGTADQRVCDFVADSPVYTVQIRHLTDGTGAVLLARVQKAYQSNDSIRGLLSHEVTAYFHLPASAQPLAVAVSGREIQQGTDTSLFRASDRNLQLANNLQLVKEGRGWKLMSLRRNTPFDALSLRGEMTAEHAGSEWPKQLLLKGNEEAIVHKGFDPEEQPFILSNPIPLPDTFTLELLLRPASVQSPYATIISNHPGKKGFQGFSLEQIGTRTNYYALGFGNGKAWMPVGEFSIPPGDLHYLAVSKDNRQVSVYLDGRRMAEKLLGADLAASEYPLTIGNWIVKDRPFNGAIQEIRLTRTVASARTVADRADTLPESSRAAVPGRDCWRVHGI